MSTTTKYAAPEELERLANGVANAYATYQGADEVFATDVLFDINVPGWRFQVEGAGAFLSWLGEHSKDGYGINVLRSVPTASGFALEIEGEYAPEGEVLFFRNLLLCEVRGARVTEVVFFCTGDWDEHSRAHWIEQAPMVRR